ncbi:META domain-containing protein [Hasllibacter halocynthiae]|nr:META domain-containing protein [Hasllibacter halocynthiae]
MALAGCAATSEGETSLVGLWTVTEIGGAAPAGEEPAELGFAEDGALSGSTGCNRVLGTWVAEGGTLNIEQPGTTMRLCAPAAMEQERRFLDIVATVETWGVEDGVLVIAGPEGTIRAVR